MGAICFSSLFFFSSHEVWGDREKGGSLYKPAVIWQQMLTKLSLVSCNTEDNSIHCGAWANWRKRFQKSTLIKHGNKQEWSKPQTTQNNVHVWHHEVSKVYPNQAWKQTIIMKQTTNNTKYCSCLASHVPTGLKTKRQSDNQIIHWSNIIYYGMVKPLAIMLGMVPGKPLGQIIKGTQHNRQGPGHSMTLRSGMADSTISY
jgi:hypothetical protein